MSEWQEKAKEYGISIGIPIGIPILWLMFSQWFTQTTDVFWYQLFLSWIIPALMFYLLIHPIAHIYQPFIWKSIVLHNNNTVSFIHTVFFGTKTRLITLWTVICILLGIIEIFSVVDHLNDEKYSTFVAIFFTGIYYVVLWLCILFVILSCLNKDYPQYQKLEDESPCLVPSYARPGSSVKYSFLPSLLMFLCVLVLQLITVWQSYANLQSSVTMYIALLIVFGYVGLSFIVNKKYDTLSFIHGILCYMISLMALFISCGLFTISYDSYIEFSKEKDTQDPQEDDGDTILIMYVVFLFTSQIMYHLHDWSIQQMTGMHLNRHYLYPYLFWNYACQFVIFGFATANWQLILLNCIYLVHQVMRSFNLYSYLWRRLRCRTMEELIDGEHIQQQKNSNLFENMILILSERQLLLQEFIAMMHTLFTFSALVYWFRHIDITTNFTKRFALDTVQFTISVIIQLFFRVIAWLLAQWITKFRLGSLIKQDNARECVLEDRTQPLVCMLTNYIQYKLGFARNSKWFNFFYRQFLLDHPQLQTTVLTCDHHITAQNLLEQKSISSIVRNYWMFFTITSMVLYTWLLMNHLSCPFRYMNLDLIISKSPLSPLCHGL